MRSGAVSDSERSACFARLSERSDSVEHVWTFSDDMLSDEGRAYVSAAGQSIEEAGMDPWTCERDEHSQSYHELSMTERSILSCAYVTALRGHPSVISTSPLSVARSSLPFIKSEEVSTNDFTLSVQVLLPSGDIVFEEDCLPATATAHSLREAMAKHGIGGALSEDEVHLVVGSSTLRADDALHSFRDDNCGNNDGVIRVNLLRDALRAGLNELCKALSVFLETILIPGAKGARCKVLYFTMAGDIYRCLATATSGEKKIAAEASARQAYEEAVRLATADLHDADSIRVGAALHLSFFYADVLGDRPRACDTARAAFENAVCTISAPPEGCYKHCCEFMKCIRDSLTLWTPDLGPPPLHP
eukprot:TRINITY_DN21608_c0_g1_i2.p1 TRINITY_DN21608_c0_g1~~TRINITY_DN21608_c0_g1_i2.p1  ORF type:complete len:361 (+),score=30.61 TRINITY_DN21608_c0_g1_i2:89-1171(+)